MTAPYCNRIDCFLDVFEEGMAGEEAGCDENCEMCSDYEEVPGPRDVK